MFMQNEHMPACRHWASGCVLDLLSIVSYISKEICDALGHGAFSLAHGRAVSYTYSAMPMHPYKPNNPSV